MKNKTVSLLAAALLTGGGSVFAQDVQVITATAGVDATAVSDTNNVSGTVTMQGGTLQAEQPVTVTSGLLDVSADATDPVMVDAVTKAVEAALKGRIGTLDAATINAIKKAVQSAMPHDGATTVTVGSTPPGGAGAGGVVVASGTLMAGPRTWLGVGADEVGDDVRAQLTLADGVGLIVRHVAQDSPAAKAGIQENDILTKFGDQLLLNSDQLRQLIQMHKEGETVTLIGLRKGKEIKFKATLIKKETTDEEPQFGVINLGGNGTDIKMGIPEEIRKLIEQHRGATTVYSGNITLPGRSNSSICSGISTKTENGQTTVTYNGKPVFAGPTTGKVSVRTMNENGQEYAAAFDGDKVLWENTPGAAKNLQK